VLRVVPCRIAAILYLSGFKQRFFYGKSYTAKENWNFSDLTYRVQSVIKREKEVIMNQITRNHVTHVRGRGSFWDANTILVRSAPLPAPSWSDLRAHKYTSQPTHTTRQHRRAAIHMERRES